MNLLFQTRKPRGYRHVPIYFDEQKERIEQARKDIAKHKDIAKRNSGDDKVNLFASTPRRRKAMGGRTMIVATIVMLMILFLLMSL